MSAYNINNSNLKHYYPFDTNLLDYTNGTGTSNTTNTSVSISTANTKLTSGSIYFSSFSSSVKIPSITFTSNGLTFAFWIKMTSPSTQQSIIDFGNSNLANNILLWITTGGTLYLSVRSPSVGTYANYEVNYTVTDTNWHHHCLIFTTGNKVNYYVDGVQTLNSSYSLYPSLSSMANSFIGGNNFAISSLIGYMNQFVCFNRALTSLEISFLYLYPAQVQISSSATAGIPSAPTITTINTNNDNILVNFTAGSNNGSTITGYKYSTNNGVTYSSLIAQTTSPLTIPGLINGTSYNVRIRAVNVVGDGAASNMVVAFTEYPCFLEGTKILRMNPEIDQEEYVPVETLKPGDLIQTSRSGYKAIQLIGKKVIYNRPDSDFKNRLFIFRKGRVKDVFEDLCITGEHCTLLYDVSEEKLREVEKYMGRIYVSEGDYRVPAHLDERAEPYMKEGLATIWHFALEHDNPFANYGVYANGLLVESSSLRYMSDLANMELVE